ncbi:replicative DNA helicase, partial [mine drainage metagenome]
MNPETGKKLRAAAAAAAHRSAAEVATALMTAWHDSLSAPPCPVTGIDPLDTLMPGLLLPGRVTVVGARPAVGKTAIAMQIAEHVGVAHDTDVVIVSLEMMAESLARRHVVARAIAQGTPLRDPHLWRDEADSSAIADGIASWGQLPYLIIDQDRRRGAVQAAIIAAVLAVRERGRRVGVVIVDYLQQITDDGAATREREVGLASVMLAETAKSLGVAMLVLAQLNRASASAAEPRPPVITDLRDSGQIEQDADAVLLLHRPTQDGAAPQSSRPLARAAQIIVGKARHWGIEPGQTIEMEDRGLRWVPAESAPNKPAPSAARGNGIPGYGLPAIVAAGWL